MAIMPLFTIRDIAPDLILIAVIAATLRQGRIFAMLCGFAVGIVYDSFGTGLLGLSSMAYCAAAYIVGVLGNEQLERRLSIVTGIFLAALLCHGLIYHFVLLLGTAAGFWYTVIRYVIPHVIYTLIFVLILHLIRPGLLWGIYTSR
jgi:rod shape-determining protein MreD